MNEILKELQNEINSKIDQSNDFLKFSSSRENDFYFFVKKDIERNNENNDSLSFVSFDFQTKMVTVNYKNSKNFIVPYEFIKENYVW